ncbi:MerR family transcriptional regulator [Brevibacterium aurantiacum]|uniref:MerR family transcriptional regulator n=1 Tax=Brevibacterium aurantiacum TaxID=273384 RepID=UPI00084CD665|nr:MerR family transcriptional regulator [Brevibacterium aurantiacum]RCS99385.1 MerR family transcriptional regulator [Brevibacterium aurantiacum]
MPEWPIRDVSRVTGVTSRALRHYEQIGLLRPSRVAENGYRLYGDAELSRLYRILSLRSLELPLATIQIALEDDATGYDSVKWPRHDGFIWPHPRLADGVATATTGPTRT